jgi:hypothetical protein
MAHQTKRTTAKKHKRAKPKTQATNRPEKPEAAKKEAPPVVDAKSSGTDDRIVAVLLAKPLAEYFPKEMAVALGQNANANVIAMRLGKLVLQQKAEKTPNGKYRAYTAKAQQIPLAS